MRRDEVGEIWGDVDGAPFRVGQVVAITDSADGSADARFYGRPGVVRGFVFDDASQVPHSPMVLVEAHGLGCDVFFPEELTVLVTPHSSRSSQVLPIVADDRLRA
jgi:hypothetical protein